MQQRHLSFPSAFWTSSTQEFSSQYSPSDFQQGNRLFVTDFANSTLSCSTEPWEPHSSVWPWWPSTEFACCIFRTNLTRCESNEFDPQTNFISHIKIFKKREFRGHEIPVNSMLILLFCWIFPALLVLPSYFKGQTGLNINTGSCTILPNKEVNNNLCVNFWPRTTFQCSGSKTFFYLFGFGFPCVTLILSDLAIWKRVKMIFDRLAISTYYISLRWRRSMPMTQGWVWQRLMRGGWKDSLWWC